METMESIISPKALKDCPIRFRSIRSRRYEQGHEGRQDVFTMEFVAHDGHHRNTKRKSKVFKDHSHNPYHPTNAEDNYYAHHLNNNVYDTDEDYYSDLDSNSKCYWSKDNEKMLTSRSTKNCDSFHRIAQRKPVDDEIHIAHRECKKRTCELCRPSVDVSNRRKSNGETEPVLFYRWEKVHNKNLTPSVFLRKVKYTVNVSLLINLV